MSFLLLGGRGRTGIRRLFGMWFVLLAFFGDLGDSHQQEPINGADVIIPAGFERFSASRTPTSR